MTSGTWGAGRHRQPETLPSDIGKEKVPNGVGHRKAPPDIGEQAACRVGHLHRHMRYLRRRVGRRHRHIGSCIAGVGDCISPWQVQRRVGQLHWRTR